MHRDPIAGEIHWIMLLREFTFNPLYMATPERRSLDPELIGKKKQSKGCLSYLALKYLSFRKTGRGGGPRKRNMYSKDFTKVLLAEVLRNYDQPISEEQAWAICFQSCCTMKVIVAQGLNSNSEIQKIVLRDVDDLYIHSDGSVSFTVQHNLNGKN